jgi:sodium/hydrogen antiporter
VDWYLLIGILLIGMVLVGTLVDRLPATPAVIYLGVGMLVGPWALDVLRVDLFADAALLEHLTEAAVVLSLFGAGLKLRLPTRDPGWWIPLRLAFGAMALTVGAIAVLGWAALGLSFGAALVLGAILAPTDPVLASEVQVRHAWDSDGLRRNLTAEAGLNDGTAFPLVYLGLGLLGLHSLGSFGARWVTVDVVWGVAGGLLVGAVVATLVGRAVLWVRRRFAHAVGLDDFLAIGIVAVAYGAALAAHTLGFLAAFAAGVAVRRIEHREMGDDPHPDARAPDDAAAATHQEQAPAYMAHALLEHNEQFERIAELALVVVVGALLATVDIPLSTLWLVPMLFLVVRPLSVAAVLVGTRAPGIERWLISWFGIRGIGSLYYLAYCVQGGLDGSDARDVAGIVLAAVAASIVVHGVSVTPLLAVYRGRRPRTEVATDGDAQAG